MEIFDNAKKLMETLQDKGNAYRNLIPQDGEKGFSALLKTQRILSVLNNKGGMEEDSEEDKTRQGHADNFLVELFNAALHPDIPLERLRSDAPRFEVVDLPVFKDIPEGEAGATAKKRVTELLTDVGCIELIVPDGAVDKLPLSAALERINILQGSLFSAWNDSLRPGCYEKKYTSPHAAALTMDLMYELAGAYGLIEEGYTAYQRGPWDSRRLVFKKEFIEKLAQVSGAQLNPPQARGM